MKVFHLIFFAFILAACSVTTSSEPPPVNSGDPRELKIEDTPLDGTVEGQAWKASKAIAIKNLDGEYTITIVGENVALTCQKSFPLAPHISFYIPLQKAQYPFDGSTGGRLVNFNFPYTTPTGGGSVNVLASKSLITIEDAQEMKVIGNVAALSAEDSSHPYEISGRFEAEICGAISSQKLEVQLNSLKAFDILYSEAIKTTTGYEIRMMNKVPSNKCDPFSGWMNLEAPVKYARVRAPAKLGSFDLNLKILEVGFLTATGGWSTDYFDGNASIKNITATEIELGLAAHSVEQTKYSVKLNGSLKIPICQ